MTIGELEKALNMTRANIRFYEQEGFIHPVRGANNYRDYSEEDLETLRRVKLLRALGLPLEEAVARAKDYLSGALRAMLDLGAGSGPLNHAYPLTER